MPFNLNKYKKLQPEAVFISVFYLVICLLWILFSDYFAQKLSELTTYKLGEIQTIKGVGFISISFIGLFLLLNRDFSKLKEKNRELEESERKHINLLHNLPGFAYRCKNDGNWTMVFINECSYLLTGYWVEELVYNNELSYVELIHPDDQDKVNNEVQRAVKNGERFQIYYRILTKDGEMKWVWEQGMLAFEEDGEQYLDGYVVDVTEIQSLRKSLGETEKYYKMLLENANDAIYVVKADVTNQTFLNFTEVNTVASGRTGMSREQLLDSNPFDIYVFKNVENLDQKILELFKTGSVSFEGYFFDDDGKIRNSEINAHLFDLMSEKTVLAISRDITERKTAQQLLEEKNNELRTLLYQASHDLRSPVTNVLGLIDIAKSEVDSKKCRYYLDLMDKSSQNLLYVVESVGSASLSKKRTLEPELINFSDLLRDLKKQFRNFSAFKEIEIEEDINVQNSFYTDKVLLEAILSNLIHNSLEYRNPSNPITAVSITKNGEDHVKIEVIDNGLGIDPSIQDKVFNMFYRGHERSKGSGLGLYIVKNSVDKLDGQLSFFSEPGKGTRFEIRLPSLAGG